MVSFQWTVSASILLVNPGNQTTAEGVPVALPLQLVNPFGHNVTYSASNLPAYLAINPSTGMITGTITFYKLYYGYDPAFQVTVYAYDGSNTVSTSFTWFTVPGFNVYTQFDRTSKVGESVNVSAGVSYNPYGHTFAYTATGLPSGLSIDPDAGVITGTIDLLADTGSPYQAHVTITDTTTQIVFDQSFAWAVEPAIVLANPGDQSLSIGTNVDLTIDVLRDFGTLLVFSATDLPIGLTIDAATGRVHGTVQPQMSAPYENFSQIIASDGTNVGQVTIHWTISTAAANVVHLVDPLHGGIVTLHSPEGTTLSARLDTPSYYGGQAYDFSFGSLQFTIDGVPLGGSADLVIVPPANRGWSQYLSFGPTPEDPSYHGYQFLYGQQTDDDDASMTGAEFVDGQIVLHLVDGARGDANTTSDGSITSLGGGAVFPALSARIAGAPQTWPLGVPLTLGSELSGEAATAVALDWQVYAYTTDFQYLQVAESSDPAVTFTPEWPGTYYVSLVATSADGALYVSDNFEFQVPDTSPPGGELAQVAVAGLPSEVAAGSPIDLSVVAEDAVGTLLDGYDGPVTVQVVDDLGTTVFFSGDNFSDGTFSIVIPGLAAHGLVPITETLTITTGNVVDEESFVVHPVTQFVTARSTVRRARHRASRLPSGC